MKRLVFVLLVIISFGWAEAIAQDITNSSRSEIFDVYSFSPHQLTKEQINAKSKVLDTFWQKAESQTNIYVPLLQVELGKQEVPAFFLYDGSLLLLRLSDTTENRRIALQAMARCDLRDVQATDYLKQVHRLAVAGEDTADAALHILTQTNFQAFIPQHSLTLGQDYALIYMLFPSDSTNWLQKAITRLGIETDAEVQTNLLLLLWYQQANDSDRAIADFASNADKPSGSRDYARALLARNGGKKFPATMSKGEKSLRESRREVMNHISDEALIEFDKKALKLIKYRTQQPK